MRVCGASWITFSGITFTATRGGDDTQRAGHDGYGAMFPHQGFRYCGEAVHLRRARHCCVEKCRFDAVGGNAIYLEYDCERNVIARNEISHAGANGVCAIGTMLKHPAFNRIEDNDIHHCGAMNKYVAGVFMGVSEGTLVAHNFIHDMPHHAINLAMNGTGRNIVEYNEIRRVGQEGFDLGAINAWMDTSSAGIVRECERSGHIIRHNLIADTLGCYVDEAGKVVAPIEETLGIYLDDCSSNCFITGNIIVRVAHAVQIHLGKNNCVENNIAVDCESLLLYVDTVSRRPGNEAMADFMTGNRTCRNILYTRHPNAVLFAMNKWTDRQIASSDDNVFFSPIGEECRIGGTAFPEALTLAQWREMGYDVHSVVADPLFADPEKEDYRLRSESPALRLGFEPIDVTRIGIRVGNGGA